MADAEMVEQGFLRGDDVADRDVRKVAAIGLAGLRVDAAGIGGAEGRADHVRGDHEQFVGVDRLARPDQAVPGARQERLWDGSVGEANNTLRNRWFWSPARWPPDLRIQDFPR
jgi:hypothetical protein